MTSEAKRTVVVTGGSRGIGRAICLALAGPDTHLFFNYHSAGEAAEKTIALVGEKGGTAEGVQADVASPESVSAFFKQIMEKTGRIDVLVNNAGVTKDGLIAMMKEADWDTVLNINLKGAFNCIKSATRPMMKQRGGRIINITSVVGAMGNAGQANYAASKAGLIGLTKSAARELASRNITVNAVAPGFVETDMTDAMTDKAREALQTQIPLRRFGQVDEVAATVAFLASDAAAYITGQVIHVNGGMYI